MGLHQDVDIGRGAGSLSTVDDLPDGIDLFALLAADGTPLVLTDDEGTAISHAIGDDLELAQLH